jgi:hypothetical protein
MTMRHRRFHGVVVAALAAGLGLGACADPAAVAEGLCIDPGKLVMMNDIVYRADADLPDAFAPGAHYATVSKLQGCEDEIEVRQDGSFDPPDNTLENGESTYLPAGTRLYVIPGEDPAEMLAVRPEGAAWQAVVRDDGAGSGF